MRLEVIEGPEKGRVFEFDQADSFLVGRSPRSHFVLDPKADRKISRTHCLLDFRPPHCLLQDLESRNGTFVNGLRIRRHELSDQDEIRVGRTLLRLHLDTSPANTQQVLDEIQADISPQTMAVIPPTLRIPAPEQDQGPVLCHKCSRNLSHRANRDGLAADLPDALYLCTSCARDDFSGAASGRKIGDYRVLREIGRGGMGVVYKTLHEPTCRLTALKKILPDAAQNEKSLKMFDREMAVQSMLVHPNLVRIVERGQHEGSYFFASEYLSGGDAHHLISQVFNGPAPESIVIKIGVDILRGLDALHSGGFVHRDLKPANFLLTRAPDTAEWSAKITDYGLAKSFEEAGNSLFDFTRMGEIAGSMMFMPPEQILEYRFVKPAADLYAVGVSLYFMLTNRYSVDFSFGAAAKGEKVRNPVEIILDDPPIPILQRQPGLGKSLAKTIDRAVKKDRNQRYRSAKEFISDLENC